MDFKSLHCFAELIRLQSFSATASALNLTQPTVSKIIQSLEEELGVPLLCRENGRKKRQVQPTAIGEEVYRHALNLLHERDLLLARVDDYRHVKSGTLRLGLALFGSDLLSHALFDFHQKWPDIELSFLEQGSLAIEQSLRNNELDAGQLLAPVHEDFDSITLCDYPLVVLMPKNRARHDALTLKSLQHEPFILLVQAFPSTKPFRRPAAIKVLRPTLSAVPDNGIWSPTWWRTIWALPCCPNTMPEKSIPMSLPPFLWSNPKSAGSSPWHGRNTNARRRP